ncbi:MAG: ASCH domain-containing protein [Candidatus Bathyarchaeia archaeon]
MPLTFKQDSLRKIKKGAKTQTRRTGRNTLQIGKIYGIVDRWYTKADTYIQITRRFKQRLGDITPKDIRKEGYSSLTEFQAAWIRLHGNWNPNKIVTVYEFQLAADGEKKNRRRDQTQINQT